MDQFLDSWHSYRFRYCSVNNLGLNVNIINGYRTQKMAENIYAIDEFGIDLMYLVLGQDKAMLVDPGAESEN